MISNEDKAKAWERVADVAAEFVQLRKDLARMDDVNRHIDNSVIPSLRSKAKAIRRNRKLGPRKGSSRSRSFKTLMEKQRFEDRLKLARARWHLDVQCPACGSGVGSPCQPTSDPVHPERISLLRSAHRSGALIVQCPVCFANQDEVCVNNGSEPHGERVRLACERAKQLES